MALNRGRVKKANCLPSMTFCKNHHQSLLRKEAERENEDISIEAEQNKAVV